ncbi:beta-propeller domain-containing protein [Flagellimonas sp. 2504JD1-5]
MKMKSAFKLGLLSLFIMPLLLMAQESTSAISHSFFIAGPEFTGIIDEAGNVAWDSEKPGARDGYVLKNGNILICWADEVREFNKKKEVILKYKRSEEHMELGTAVRLSNGNTMITESGTRPRIVEINKKGEAVKSVPLQPETDNVHMQTRMARKLKNGNYLVPHLLAFAVKEYRPDGTIVNTFSTDFEVYGGRKAETWPFTAIRMKNGHTLVTLTHGNRVVELDAKGDIIWQIDNSIFDGDPLVDPCGAQRLPNGNTVIASYGAQKGIKLFEVTKSKNIVWTYNNYRAHHFQILTTNGKPLKGAPLK